MLSQSYATDLYGVLSFVDEQAVHLLKYNILFYLYSQQDPNFLESRFCLRLIDCSQEGIFSLSSWCKNTS